MIGRRSLLAAAGLALLVPAAGCSTSNPSADADKGFAVGDGSFSQLEVGKREKAPTLSGAGLDGRRLSTAGAAGKVIVVNVWGSWCAPCRHEAPALVAAAKRTSGVAQFFGINTRDLDRAPATAFVRAFGLTWPSFYDPDGDLLLRFSDLPPKAIPSTLIIDRRGRTAARFLGEVSTTTLAQVVAQIAEEPR